MTSPIEIGINSGSDHGSDDRYDDNGQLPPSRHNFRLDQSHGGQDVNDEREFEE